MITNNLFNEKFLEVSEPFFKKVLTRRRQQAAAPYSRSWCFPTFKYHLKSNRVHIPHDGRRPYIHRQKK
jgi:hypothetical protein